MYISGRERKVLDTLLEKQGNITVSQLAEMLGVSSRTVHRDLKNLEEMLVDYDLRLDKKAGVGVKIIGDEAQMQALEIALLSVNYTDYTPEERQAIILTTLLEKNEPMKLFALADELNVTVATVSNDLDRIEEELKSYKLTLVRKRGYGVEVSGKEENKRAVLNYLILRHIDEIDFVSILRENIQKKSKQHFDTISNRLLGLVDKEKLYIIEKIVAQIQKSLPYELADSAYIGLVVHLALAVERLQKGDTIHFDKIYLKQIDQTREYEIAGNIIKDLERAFEMKIPADEIGYITMHLMGAKLRGDQVHLLEEFNVEMMEKVQALIRYVSNEINKDLTENNKLLNDLISHLKPTIYRLNQQMKITNPLLDEIRRDYKDLFEILREGVQLIFTDYQFPEEEVGYLVLHFASVILSEEEEIEWKALVICSSGIGTAKMLATRLTQEFPDIKTVHNVSLFELDSLSANEYDLIVSTVPIKGNPNRYIQVSPILTKNEIREVEKHFRRLKINRNTERTVIPERESVFRETIEVMPRLMKMQSYSKAALDILTNFFIESVNGREKISDFLEAACLILKEKEIINDVPAVLDKILAREKIGGIGIPGTTLALYHTRTSDVNIPSFTIFNLPKVVKVKGMDENEVRVKRLLIMLAPEQVSQEALEVIGGISALLVQDARTTNLFEEGNEEEIKQFLSGRIDLFITEKISRRSV